MAAVLKSFHPSSDPSSAVPIAFNVRDVHYQAESYLREVQQRGQEILCAAERDAAAIRETAEQQGYAEAEAKFSQRLAEEARRLSDDRCRLAISACEQTVQELGNDTADWLAKWRDQTISLAVCIAEKLIRNTTEPNKIDLLRTWLEEAICKISDTREIRVHVHPDDFSTAGECLSRLAASVPHAATAQVIPDVAIEAGGCLVRTTHGQVDQQLSTQLQRLVEQLT